MINIIKRFLIIFCFLISKPSLSLEDIDNKYYYNRSSKLGLVFLQNNVDLYVTNNLEYDQNFNSFRINKINIEDKLFSILVPNKSQYHAIRICASYNKEMFIHANININKEIKNIPCFAPGTGMAVASENQTFPLIISTGNTHNYFHLSRTINSKKVRQIRINSIKTRKNVKFQEGPIYLMILIDFNNDGIVDEREYEFVVLNIK